MCQVPQDSQLFWVNPWESYKIGSTRTMTGNYVSLSHPSHKWEFWWSNHQNTEYLLRETWIKTRDTWNERKEGVVRKDDWYKQSLGDGKERGKIVGIQEETVGGNQGWQGRERKTKGDRGIKGGRGRWGRKDEMEWYCKGRTRISRGGGMRKRETGGRGRTVETETGWL